MLFRWFVGLTIDAEVFDASTFSKNRDRLLTHEIAQEFLSSLLGLPEVKGLLSAEHFSVDGTMLKAWASMKSFRPKDASGEGPGNGPAEPPPGRNGEIDFRKTKLIERDARLDDGQGCAPLPQGRRAGEPSGLSRPRLDGEPQRAGGGGRGDAGDRDGRARGGGAHEPALAQGGDPPCADKGYDAEAFVEACKGARIEPHVAINGTVSKTGKARKTAVPSEVAASVRYAVSQRLRKRIEEGFGWTKTVGGLMQVKVRGLSPPRSAPSSSSPWPPTTSFACPSSWPRRAKCVRRHEQPENNDPTAGQNLKNEPHPPAKNRACLPGCANAVTFSAAC